jgi:hypothetical protein
MRRLGVIIGIILGACTMLEAQTLIGLSKEEVAERIQQDYREFRKDASVIRQQFNYIKYVNGIRTKTWILYFDGSDTCTSSKLICDYAELNDVLRGINAKYESAGEDVWEYTAGTDTIKVELQRQEWYFTIRESGK